MIKGMYKVNLLEFLYQCAVAIYGNHNQRQSVGS